MNYVLKTVSTSWILSTNFSAKLQAAFRENADLNWNWLQLQHSHCFSLSRLKLTAAGNSPSFLILLATEWHLNDDRWEKTFHDQRLLPLTVIWVAEKFALRHPLWCITFTIVQWHCDSYKFVHAGFP